MKKRIKIFTLGTSSEYTLPNVQKAKITAVGASCTVDGSTLTVAASPLELSAGDMDTYVCKIVTAAGTCQIIHDYPAPR